MKWVLHKGDIWRFSEKAKIATDTENLYAPEKFENHQKVELNLLFRALLCSREVSEFSEYFY
jgi:hypothetical protein